MSCCPSILTKSNHLDLNAVLLKCFQALGVNSDTIIIMIIQEVIVTIIIIYYVWHPHFDAESLFKT